MNDKLIAVLSEIIAKEIGKYLQPIIDKSYQLHSANRDQRLLIEKLEKENAQLREDLSGLVTHPPLVDEDSNVSGCPIPDVRVTPDTMSHEIDPTEEFQIRT